MLVEYLDNAARELAEMREKARHMYEKYEETLDKDLRHEIAILKKKATIKKHMIWETVYENLEEFRFMKKHFPQLFQTYIEDDDIGKILKKKEWLADFKEMKKENAEMVLNELKKKIESLKRLKTESKEWKEPYTEKMFGGTWFLVKDHINEKTDKHELTQVLNAKIAELRKNGWCLLLNEPFIAGHVSRYLTKLKYELDVEAEARKKMEQSKGQGTYWEYKAKQALNKAIKNRKRIEAVCKHLLMANPKFLRNFKKQRMHWRDRELAGFIKRIFEETTLLEINEKEWLEEMKKKLEG